MRHVNPNMSQPVLEGIKEGEAWVCCWGGDAKLAEQVAIAEEMTAQLASAGDRPFVVGGFIKARRLAYAQGFIAAYRSGSGDF